MKWLTVKEAADALRCNPKTIRRRLKKGEWESKEETNPNGGSDIVKLRIDVSSEQLDTSVGQLDTSEKSSPLFSAGQLDTSEKSSPLFSAEQLDKLQESDKNPEDLTHPAVSTAVGQLDKSEKTPLNSTIDSWTPPKTVGHLSWTVGQLDSWTPQLDISDEQLDTPTNTNTDPLKWIPLDRAEELAGISRSGLFRMLKRGDLFSIVISDDISKHRTMIDVSGFSRDVQLRWKSEVLSDNAELSSALAAEKREFDCSHQEDKAKAWCRKRVIDEFCSYREASKISGTTYGAADRQFEIKLNNREILPGVLKQMGMISVSIKTIKKWEKAWRDSGNNTYPISLLERRKGVVGRPKSITSKLEKRVKGLATNFRELPATGIYRMLEDELALQGKEMPISVRTLTLAVSKARKNKTAIALSKGKKAYKDQIRPHVFRINNAMPNDLWESDGHHMNNLVLSPFYAHNKPQMRFLVKPILIVWYDIATGLIAGHLLTLTENQNAIRTSLKKAIQQYGLPQEIRVDNGSGYKNVNHSPHVFAGRKRVTAQVKKARDMIQRGDNGLYANLGIKYSFTIPGNAESKMIEPFWGFCFSMFEKAFPIWIGNKIENRHEELRLTNKTLIKKYGDQIPTWEQYSELLDHYVSIWNNQKRSVLRNGMGEQMSPLEAFSEQTVTIPSSERLDSIITHKYPQRLIVYRGQINVSGILYSHPSFMALEGKKVSVYYDESELKQVIIGSEHGEIFSEPATIIYPGLQIGDDMSAYVETKHREKIQKSVYLALESADSEDYNSLLLQSSEDMLEDQERIQIKQKHSERLRLGNVRQGGGREIKFKREIEISDAEFEEIARKAKNTEVEASEDDIITDELLQELQNNIRVDEEKDSEIQRAFDKLGIQ